MACDIDVTALYKCRLPAILPSSPAEGLVSIWGALQTCVIAAETTIEQVERVKLRSLQAEPAAPASKESPTALR
jgi:hypothetical protein